MLAGRELPRGRRLFGEVRDVRHPDVRDVFGIQIPVVIAPVNGPGDGPNVALAISTQKLAGLNLSLLLLEERKRVCHAFVGIGSGDMIRVTANDDES